MPSTSEISIFQRSNPAVALWAQDPQNAAEDLYGELCMENEERDQVYLAIRLRGIGMPEPAAMYDSVEIPNGDWHVQTTEGVNFSFRIWRVQSGRLQGKRIIKIRNPQTGIYSGFAFLSRTGNVLIWDRFARDADAPYVQAVNSAIVSFCNTHLDEGIAGYHIERRCPICNSPEDDDASVRLCANHAHARDNNPGNGFLMRERRSVTTIRTDRDPDQPIETYNAPTPTESSETPDIPLCENGSGLIR